MYWLGENWKIMKRRILKMKNIFQRFKIVMKKKNNIFA